MAKWLSKAELHDQLTPKAQQCVIALDEFIKTFAEFYPQIYPQSGWTPDKIIERLDKEVKMVVLTMGNLIKAGLNKDNTPVIIIQIAVAQEYLRGFCELKKEDID